MNSISLLTQVKDLGDANKVFASPPQWGGLQAQSRSLPKSGTWVTYEYSYRFTTLRRWLARSISLLTQVGDLGDMWIRLSFHHLEEMACKLNLHALWGSRYYPETILIQYALCALIWGLLIQFAYSVVVLSLELTLLSWDNTRSVCALYSNPGFAHSICAIYHRAKILLLFFYFEVTMFDVSCPSKF